MARYRNESEHTYKFRIWGSPGLAPKDYAVAPGEVCDVPDGYAGNFMTRRAPGLVRVADDAEALKPAPSPEGGKPPAPKADEPEAPAAPAPEEPEEAPEKEPEKSPMAAVARKGRRRKR